MRRPSVSGTNPTTVSITAPASGATVSGTAVTVAATASDNVGVAGMQFKLDGASSAQKMHRLYSSPGTAHRDQRLAPSPAVAMQRGI